MIWLAAQGHQLIGVELSEIAVREFFDSAGLEPKVSNLDEFRLFETPQIKIYCGDIFSIQSNHLAEVSAIYDRGALVALTPEMRKSYVTHLSHVLPMTVKGLLIAMEYNQDMMQGPPFSVETADIRDLFDGFDDVDTLASEDIEFRDQKVRMRIWKYLRQ